LPELSRKVPNIMTLSQRSWRKYRMTTRVKVKRNCISERVKWIIHDIRSENRNGGTDSDEYTDEEEYEEHDAEEIVV
jgi:hypothetical protein